MIERGSYHHGDLRAALIDAALAIVAEKGVAGLSVAETARRTGVSAAAPYRHYASRTELLSAAATASGRLLLAQMRVACDEVRKRVGDSDGDVEFAVESLAASARVYVTFAVAHGAAFELILADELQDHPDAERREVTRELMDQVLWPAITVTGSPTTATQLLWRFTAVVHGFAYLPGSGFVRGHAVDVDFAADQAADVIRTLARAATPDASATGRAAPVEPDTA